MASDNNDNARVTHRLVQGHLYGEVRAKRSQLLSNSLESRLHLQPCRTSQIFVFFWQFRVQTVATAMNATGGVQITPHRSHTRALFLAAHDTCDNTFGSRISRFSVCLEKSFQHKRQSASRCCEDSLSVGVLRIKMWHLVYCFVWVPSKTLEGASKSSPRWMDKQSGAVFLSFARSGHTYIMKRRYRRLLWRIQCVSSEIGVTTAGTVRGAAARHRGALSNLAHPADAFLLDGSDGPVSVALSAEVVSFNEFCPSVGLV